MQYLHSLGIIHRDIKGNLFIQILLILLGAHILLTSSGSVKIGDFGSCGSLRALKLKRTENIVGTPHWYYFEFTMH